MTNDRRLDCPNCQAPLEADDIFEGWMLDALKNYHLDSVCPACNVKFTAHREVSVSYWGERQR